MDEVRIEQWSVCVGTKDPYAPPDGLVLVLKGNVYGHPVHPDGRRVTTSFVQYARGRVVTCVGRRYILGEVDPAYFRWLQANGHQLDQNNPIKIGK